MARQRVRAELTWKAAKAERKTLVEKLAKKAIASAGSGPANGYNTQEHWKDVGKYELLNGLLWECDK